MTSGAGRLLALPSRDLVPPAASDRLLAAFGGVQEVLNLGFEHEVGRGVVGYGYGVTRAQVATEGRRLPPPLGEWAATPNLWDASPCVYLEYDGDHEPSAPPHVFFQIPRLDRSIPPSPVVDLLLGRDDPAEARGIRRVLQRLVDRLPRKSRSGFLGHVARHQTRELRCQFPIDVREVRPLLDVLAGSVADDAEPILCCLERADLLRMNLQLGIRADGISSRVGVELGVTRVGLDAPRVWRTIVDGLVEEDVAATFREQLDGWWGRNENPVPHARWTHLKLSTGRDRIELKHYLWMQTLEETHELGERR